ncbi:iron-sulfur cluster assembly protein, partial [Pseudonocardia dioxanivorans]|uniref:iron-sulfur cluster assembly protein n=1 Tax=Pseudonocardia dioxanivorans TaxID=240495 RepID=UPI0039899595
MVSAPARPAARAVVARVVDPEMPMLTLDDLGVVRSVETDGDAVTVTITPTYSGCPAVAEMSADLRAALTAAGYGPVQVRTVLAPAWSTDWISDDGRAAGVGRGDRDGDGVPVGLDRAHHAQV